jgi:hypothetical protein
MTKAMDCPGALLRPVVILLGLCACSLELGCAGMSGLRSMGIDAATILGYRNRSGPGSPSPENDYYVQAMNSPRVGSAPSAKNAEKAPRAGEVETAPAAPIIRSADESENTAHDVPATRVAALDGPGSVKVSLGAPEPLPALARASAPPENVASADSVSRWKAESTKPELAELPALSSPTDREDLKREAASEVAADPRPTGSPLPSTLLAQAERKLRSLATYQVKITRQERVQGRLEPEEDIILSIRSEPKAVRLEWSSGPSKGREVIYSRALDPGMIFVHQPGAALVVPSMKISVDSPLVTRNSRHSITEAGLDTILANMQGSQASSDKRQSQRGELVYQALETAPGLDQPCHHFVRHAAGGETWNVYLDSRSLLPRLVVAHDAAGQLIERYVYREIRENPAELALAGSFDPENRWGASQGLFSRLARAAAGSNLPATGASTTR